jgi:preprotein translocase subunit SecE
MAGLGQYFKDTRGELRHVAWPTQTQTIVYTILVAALSVGVALYLGLFDYIFTTALTRLVGVAPAANPIQVTQQAATSSNTAAPSLNLPSASSTQ